MDDSALDDDLLARYRTLPAANVGDAMERLGAMDSALRPMYVGARITAPAYTILTRAGDNQAIHDALAVAPRGHVLVVNGFGDTSRALIGELLAGRAKAAGLAGFVIDGAVRDVAELEAIGMATFARAATPAGPYKFGPARHQVPIACGGVCVLPGDLIVADADGVVVVPRAEARDVLVAAEAIFAREAEMKAEIAALLGGSTAS